MASEPSQANNITTWIFTNDLRDDLDNTDEAYEEMTYAPQQCKLSYYAEGNSDIVGQISFTMQISDGVFVLGGVEIE